MSDVLFSWIHLSDIHGGHGDAADREDQAWSFRSIVEAVAELPLAIPRIDAIFVTGDVGFSGEASGRRVRADAPPYRRAPAVPGDRRRSGVRHAR